MQKCLHIVILIWCSLLSGASAQGLSAQSSQSVLCLRDVVWAEARGESEAGQRAVAHVVLNRARQSGKSVCAVTKEAGQFKRSRPPKSFRVAVGGADPTNGATYFRTKDAPSWYGYKKKIRIGGHSFYGP